MNHLCHNPNCTTPCPPKMFACRSCWFSLPKRLRDVIWQTYVIDQELRKNPSAAYLEATSDAIKYWKTGTAPEETRTREGTLWP